MSLTVLNVAYPFAPVGPDAVGGAEQVLSAVDHALVRAGHRSIVLACEGSRVEGELVACPAVEGSLTDEARSRHLARYRELLREVLLHGDVDVVHYHGVDFAEYRAELGPPAFATLHLPPDFYPARIFEAAEPCALHCVSSSQRSACPPGARLLPDVENGVDLERFSPSKEKDVYALVLSRICPEKGIHLALEAARAAGVPLRIAGRVFPYPDHERYFAEQVRPRLDAERCFLGAIGMPEKAELIARARCLVVPSLVAETSSLVAMEALACGTPVVAFRRGALTSVVEPGVTGHLADDVAGLSDGIRRARDFEPARCRAVASSRFSADRMTERYLELYRSLAGGAGHDTSIGLRQVEARADDSRVIRMEPRARGSSSALSVEVLSSTVELERLSAEWHRLWLRSSRATVFQSPAWLLSWNRHFAPQEPLVLTLRCRGALVGMVPLFSWEDRGARVLSLMGAGVSDYQDALFEDEHAAACQAAVSTALLDASMHWDRLSWTELADRAWLAATPLGELPIRVTVEDVCPGLDLGSSGPSLEQLLPKRQCERVRYAQRRAERELGVTYEHASPENFESLFEALERLHASRWRLRGAPGMFAEPAVAAFHRAAARGLLESGHLMLFAVRLGGAPAALLYGFQETAATRYYLGGFEPALSKFSPGLLAIAHAVERAASGGARVFDFLRGGEPYKYGWGARDLTRLRSRVAERSGDARVQSA